MYFYKIYSMKIKNILIVVVLLFATFPIGINAQYILPGYMKKYGAIWKNDPKKASLEWFRDAGFGMFVHFSPASMLPGGTSEGEKLDSWFEGQKIFEQMDRYSRKQQLSDKLEKVSPEVEKLIYDFNPVNFNADSIADLAVSAGMQYITFTTKHVFGQLYMFDTSLSKWNSKNILNRDFLKELSDACQKRNLGLFLYVTPPNDYIKSELKVMLKELLTNYGVIAGVWFDGIGECYRRPNDFLEISELYAYINELQPQCLISFKTGFSGDEDFLAPEWTQIKYEKSGKVVFNIRVRTNEGLDIENDITKRPVVRITRDGLKFKYQSFKETWENELVNKPIELCNTILKGEQWFNVKDGIHKTREEVLSEYNYARKNNANYLLNIAPIADGSIHPADREVLLGFGEIKDRK